MAQSQSNISQLKDFLSYLVTVKGDLSNITAPPFTLSPKSVLEIPASWAERHDLFMQPAQEKDAAQRSLLVLKNFLCSLKRQVYTAATSKGCSDDDCGDDGVKKPLNAFLGELFLGTFEGNDGSTTRLICEQVSHHPPVTACCLYNEIHGISSSGYVAQEITFNPASGVRVKQIGHAIIRDEGHGESHLMTLPTIVIKGLPVGRPYPELEGTCYISSSSGYLATIDFQGKSMLGSGKKNSVHAEISNVRDGDKMMFEVTGQWNDRLTIVDSTNGKQIDDFYIDDVPLAELQTKSLEEQSSWESRKAWSKVAEGIGAGSMHVVGDEKSTIEDAQREMRAAEKSVGVEWPRLFFQNSDRDDQEFALLAKIIPDQTARNLNQERTAGVWKFIGVGAAEALLSDGIFHRSLAPTGQTEYC
ncbi:Oxysterol-binding protein [Daldinia vernicosa]|uniref:Oxysterol-binding protein n=1 Tax=Daldinia vernicosa TaxID=114800 RepID=UPI0020076B9F|nr:Oxysterol-binding protein [Daldinia vernicosa]KAI0848384.1 Oxysterol-binding protein [Daldinia vernicosa]